MIKSYHRTPSRQKQKKIGTLKFQVLPMESLNFSNETIALNAIFLLKLQTVAREKLQQTSPCSYNSSRLSISREMLATRQKNLTKSPFFITKIDNLNLQRTKLLR